MTEIIKEGDNLPDMAIKAIVKDEIKDAKLSTLFADHSLMHPKDKKIVLFSVPGAFTPTCSAKHLPGFLTYASAFKEKKVDDMCKKLLVNLIIEDYKINKIKWNPQ